MPTGRRMFRNTAVLFFALYLWGLPMASRAMATPPARMIIEVTLYSHFTQSSDMKCVGWGPYEGINDQADLLVSFGNASDVANNAGGGIDPTGRSCSLFYGIQVPLVDAYQLQFMQSEPFLLSSRFGPYTSSLLLDEQAPAGTRQLFADLP
jgi:hypothetical protein